MVGKGILRRSDPFIKKSWVRAQCCRGAWRPSACLRDRELRPTVNHTYGCPAGIRETDEAPRPPGGAWISLIPSLSDLAFLTPIVVLFFRRPNLVLLRSRKQQCHQHRQLLSQASFHESPNLKTLFQACSPRCWRNTRSRSHSSTASRWSWTRCR